jgi:hypothetical protein
MIDSIQYVNVNVQYSSIMSVLQYAYVVML